MTADRGGARLAELDALRGIAALAVALYHFVFRYGRHDIVPRQTLTYVFGYFPVPEHYIGALPVYLFFMISGFVIFFTAGNCKTMAQFGFRRFSRLYPVYWGSILVILLAMAVFGWPDKIDAKVILINLTMLQGYVMIPPIADVFWSLTVELSFYFLMALAIGAGMMPFRKPILLLWSVLIFLYGFYDIPNPIPWPIVYLLVLDYGHFFVFGIAVYELWRAQRAGVTQPDSIIVLLLLISFASSIIRYPAFVCAVIFAVHGVFYLAVAGRLAFLRNRRLLYLGGVSYAFYLVHQVLGEIVMNNLMLPRPVEITSALGVGLLTATALTSGIEQPAMRWLRAHRPAWAGQARKT